VPKAGKGGKGLLSLLGVLDGGKDLNNGDNNENDIGSVAENTKSKDLALRLRAFFNNEESKVKLAFLIGSFAKGTARKDSDVDVAVFFGSSPDIEDVLELTERLSLLLKRDVDLVVLDTAGPVIKIQAPKTGILLRADEGAYEDFFVSTINEYDDLKCLHREAEESVLRRRIYA